MENNTVAQLNAINATLAKTVTIDQLNEALAKTVTMDQMN
jgi:hypothetical protein